jgi:hypothetical protein
MILVRHQIRDMLGGETRKFTFRRINYKFMTSGEKNTVYWYIGRVGISMQLLGLRQRWSRGGIRP